MKRIFLLWCIFFASAAFAQDKVKWEITYNQKSHQIEFRAEIAGGWHLYSQHIKNDIGPVPTAFTFKNTGGVKLLGEVKEPEAIHEYDENFEASLDFFKNQVVFTQSVDPKTKGEINGYITFMVCNDVMCLPPVDIDFTLIIP